MMYRDLKTMAKFGVIVILMAAAIIAAFFWAERQ